MSLDWFGPKSFELEIVLIKQFNEACQHIYFQTDFMQNEIHQAEKKELNKKSNVRSQNF